MDEGKKPSEKHTNGDVKINVKAEKLNDYDEMRHRVLSGVGIETKDQYAMDQKAMTTVDWNKGVVSMHKKADFTENLYAGVDMKKLGERQRRRKERKELALKYAGNVDVGFNVQINQIKKEEQEDKQEFGMQNRIYSSMDVMRVNYRHVQDYKKVYAEQDKIDQHGAPVATDHVDLKQIELGMTADVHVDTNTNLDVKGTTTHQAQDNNFGLGDKAWHAFTPFEIMQELVTSSEGLTTEEHARRLEEHGLNQITPVPQLHWFLKFLLHLVGGFQIFLWTGGILCVVVFGINYEMRDYQTLALGILCFIVVLGTAIFTKKESQTTSWQHFER
jgi:magnesium-transporting ATPase (P-type)